MKYVFFKPIEINPSVSWTVGTHIYDHIKYFLIQFSPVLMEKKFKSHLV